MTPKDDTCSYSCSHFILLREFPGWLILVLLASCFAQGQMCDSWQWRSPYPQGNDLHDATLTNNNLIYCGNNGTILELANGEWINHTVPTLYDLNGIAANGSTVVAAGDEGTIVYTTNGVDWNVIQVKIDGGFHKFRDVHFAAGQFVVVGRSGKMATSPNGIDWTPRTSGSAARLYRIGHDGTHFWIVGRSGTLLKSADAITWQAINSGTTADLHGFAFGNNTWIAVGDASTLAMSGDGDVFSEVFVANATDYRAIHWNGSRFVIVGTAGRIATSLDGMGWGTGMLPEERRLEAVQYADGIWHCGGEQGVIYDGDGTLADWALTQIRITQGTIRGLVDMGSYTALIDSNGRIQTSTDLDSWTIAFDPGSFSGYAAASNGVEAIFTGSGSTVVHMTAPDTLQSVSLGGQVTYRGAAHWQGLWIVVGNDGAIATSSDALTWQAQSSATDLRLRAVTGSPNRLVAVGDSGTLVYSDDGQTWLAAISPTNRGLLTVAWNGSFFLAGGTQGTLLKSTDGISWELVNIPFNNTINDIAWGLDMWAIATIGGTIQISADAVSWKLAPFEVSFPWSTLIAKDDQWLVAGNLGHLATGTCSPCDPPTVTDEPLQVEACPGGSASFSPQTTGGPFSDIMWTRDGVPLGETELMLDLVSLSGADSGTYAISLTNACGTSINPVANLQVADPFELTLPIRTLAQGLCPLRVEADLRCGSGTFEVEWWRADLSQMIASGNPLVLDPAPSESFALVAIATDLADMSQQTQELAILVSQDTLLFDLNGDGTNTLADLLAYLPFWNTTAPDANADGRVDVRDLLFVNTLDGLYCAPSE